jgi:hypothetical protein
MLKDKWKIFAVNEASSDNNDMDDGGKVALFDDLADRRKQSLNTDQIFNYYDFVPWEELQKLSSEDIAFHILRLARVAQETEDLP